MKQLIEQTHEQDPQRSISFTHAFWFWLKLGFISFGGPAGQIAIMHKELVDERRWISERRFLHALNYCMVLPGPEAQQLATYIGWLMHGIKGGVIAGVLFVLPSLFILIALAWVYLALGHLSLIEGIFLGIKPVVVAIVLHAAYRIGSRALKKSWLWGVAAGSFTMIFIWNIGFPIIVLSAAAIGLLLGRYYPHLFDNSASHAVAQSKHASAVIDDETPAPGYAKFTWVRVIKIMIVAVILWGLPIATLWSVLGWTHSYTQMAWFFTKAALLTFGGAYAVLPYVYQAAVTQYAWVTPAQMIDGLALGETTPGPLIMIVAFVGFVGGYSQALLGENNLFLAGAIAASIATWFTFLPSFIFIFLGAPLIESTHQEVEFTAPLTVITAAVVGVILNLAMFFAQHVLWPQGWEGELSWQALVLMLAALVALFRFKIGVVKVLGVAALCGVGVAVLSS